MNSVLYLDNAMVVGCVLTDTGTGDPVTGADVRLTLFDDTGAELPDISWPQSMSHTENGDYQVKLPSSLGVASGSIYSGLVQAYIGGVLEGTFNCKFPASRRGCS